MKLALIPPTSLLQTAKGSDYHLLLPHLFADSTYVDFYRRERANGAYLILDNGVAEGLDYTMEELNQLGQQMMVNEIVLPDVLGNAAETVAKAQGASAWVRGAFNYMGVIQGKNPQQLLACAKAFADLPYITTVGIPRHILTSLNAGPEDHYRAQAVRVIRNQFEDRFQIHLLGTNPKYIAELMFYDVAFDRHDVRGVDTSAPYNYTFANEPIRPGVEINRPADYFNLAATSLPDPLLTHNLNRVRKWVTQ
jgi:hypothetical protein